MRIKATIKVNIKSILSQWKELVLMFSIFPLIMAGIMGNFQKDVFKPEVSSDKININIIDKDNSETTKSFKGLFETKELKEIFNVTDKGQYEITIPEGYEKDIINLKETTIVVNEKKRVSRINELIIKSVIEQYGKTLTENAIISNEISTMSVVDKDKLFNEVISNINKNSSITSLKQNIIQGERVLTSFENQAATMMVFMLFTIIICCIAGFDMDKTNGSNRRLLSTPITKCKFFNLGLLTFFITSLVCGTFYILSFRITGLAFKGINPLNIIAILICQSLLITTLSGIIIAFFGKNVANTVVVVLMYLQIIFGGGFIPLKDINNNVFLSISRFLPGNIISETYTNCILFNSFNSISKYLIIMLLISIVVYCISILKVKIKWEV
ncbi:ABC transporter permease [Clostridium gasigenes]|uniref:ABC transporter permease n=1 Tax=Clostridium gasigenes TaxID=94869 RepID=UPI0014384266|nr:ABC transporter permease [Clostridium gasigenes]NKF06701.1 ABC transporter permease [Clostridium gasigenes]QSW20951.1 ABC transporter permease [Clostridium gasigenes]